VSLPEDQHPVGDLDSGVWVPEIGAPHALVFRSFLALVAGLWVVVTRR
jgi:hypothetical protein